MSVIVLVRVPIGHCCQVAIMLSFQICSAQFAKKRPSSQYWHLLALCNIVYIVWYYICQLNQHIYKYSLFNSVFVCISVMFDIFVFYSFCVCITNAFANHFFNFQLCVCPLSSGALHADTCFNHLLGSSQQSLKSKTLMKSFEGNNEKYSKYFIEVCHSVK